MAIKDRDGKIYKLRGPNPIMRTQHEWDRSKVQTFNIRNWRSEIVIDERNPVKKFEEEHVVDIADVLPKDQTKTVPARNFIQEIQAAPIPELPPVTLTVEPTVARLLKERGVEFHCAPAIGRKTEHDALYGNTYTVIEYGDKFIFDAIAIDQSDLEFQFWCVKAVTVDSIIYRKHRQGGERWWKISDAEANSGGWLVKAIPSMLNPDFS